MQIFRLEQVLVEGRLADDLVPVANQLARRKAGSTRSSDCGCTGWMTGRCRGPHRRESRRLTLQVAQNIIEFPFQIRRRLKSVLWMLRQHFFQKRRDPRMELHEDVGWQLLVQVLIDDSGHRTLERRPSREHEPEGRAKGIDVRPDIYLLFLQLLRARKVWRPDKSAHRYG